MKFKIFMGVLAVAVLVVLGGVMYKASNYQVQEGDQVLVDKKVVKTKSGEEITQQAGEVVYKVEGSEDNIFKYKKVFIGKKVGDTYEVTYKLKDDITSGEEVLYKKGTKVTETGTIKNIESSKHLADMESLSEEQSELDAAKEQEEQDKEATE